MHRYFLSVLILLPLLVVSGVTHAAVNLAFNPASQLGNAINVELIISGLDAGAPSLSAYDVDISFDNHFLAFTGAEFGDPLLGNQLDLSDLGLNPAGADILSPGLLNLYEQSLLDTPINLNTLQADNFSLATLTFTVLNNGNSQLNIAINTLADADGEALTAEVAPATIHTVPLPSGIWLMASGLRVFYRKRTIRRA